MSIKSRLVEGTEVLRTGGGTGLSVIDCHRLLDVIEAAEEAVVDADTFVPGKTKTRLTDLKEALKDVRSSV